MVDGLAASRKRVYRKDIFYMSMALLMLHTLDQHVYFIYVTLKSCLNANLQDVYNVLGNVPCKCWSSVILSLAKGKAVGPWLTCMYSDSSSTSVSYSNTMLLESNITLVAEYLYAFVLLCQC